MRAARLTLRALLLASLAASGCGGQKQPDADAVIAQSQRATEEFGSPMATLGRRAAGYDARSVWSKTRGWVVVYYGPAACESEGSCRDRLWSATKASRWPTARGGGCWRRLGRAWEIACRGPHEVLVLTDRVLVEVGSDADEPDVRPLIGQLRLGLGGPGELPPARRLTCAEYRRWPAALRKTVPDPLRPACAPPRTRR